MAQDSLDLKGAKILIVDDAPDNLKILLQSLEPEGYTILATTSGESALKIAAEAQPDLIVLDVLMPDMDGYETCRRFKQEANTRDIPVIFVTAKTEIEGIVEGFQAGGVDYIVKPFRNEELLARTRTHLENALMGRALQENNRELEQKNEALQAEITRRQKLTTERNHLNDKLSVISQRDAEGWDIGGHEEFIGDSTTLAQVQHQLAQVGPTDMTVLVFGETGTGKGVAVRALHRLSQRRRGPFIQVNCGAIPDNLVESELFGHEKGAFTGADRRQLGKVELAQGGTLFLDEIGDMPLAAQVKLLRLLEERQFERVGGSQTLEVDTRFVAATNRELEQMVQAGDFRQDLFYRLRTFVVDLPPLRDRQADIALLAHYFLERFAAHLNRPLPMISAEAQAQLKAYAWPGNVRELEHLMQRAALICRDDRIEAEDLGLERSAGGATGEEGLFLSLAEQEKRYIERALEASNWVVYGEEGAARLLDINPNTLRSRMRKHGIRRSEKA